MTSQRSPYTRFKRALDTGNLTIIRAAAAELPRVDLGDALRILWLMREDEQLYERAAMRWLGGSASINCVPRLTGHDEFRTQTRCRSVTTPSRSWLLS